MTLKTDVEKAVKEILDTPFDEVNGTVVPKTVDVALKNGAKIINATYVYADLADSTGLAHRHQQWATAKVIRTYLAAATRILKVHGGEIRSFDGDRVRAIFIGDNKNTNAVYASQKLGYAIDHIIDPALKESWSDFKWTMSHGVGIDTGEAMVVRGGVRGDNDLISIGRAPNVAAKLSEKREGQRINISSRVFGKVNDNAKYSASGEAMWTEMGTATYGGSSLKYYGSNWWRSF